MNDSAVPLVNAPALEPLFAPWDEPIRHRVRATVAGAPPEVRQHRRPSTLKLVNPLRAAVKEWRDLNYPGASDTTRELLNYWFGRPHRMATNGGENDFRYYFCQREAIETVIYLIECRGLRCLSELLDAYGGASGEIEALGVDPKDDEWARYALKLATGAGKTKVMSLAIVWSYFHALREPGSDMARHFLLIAPSLTVFERLRQDFLPEGGGPDIFTSDPLIPPEWRGDWNFSVALQDEAAAGTTGGVLYLTNIHRLYEPKVRGKEDDTYSWAGPAVAKGKALDTAAVLRDRITSHKRLMVLNDEAHHVWDPGSAWNASIRYLHDVIREKGGSGIVGQLDLSATPKNDKGIVFPHVVCDTPLGEAVDAGIVKTPILGRSDGLVEQTHTDASYQWESHLRLGYERWKASRVEWEKSGKKPLLFVMCESTEAADQISRRLNADPVFKDLNNKTINLHTNLKGKVKRINQGGRKVDVFVEDEKEISDDDLRAIRRISRELDSPATPYSCIVSVLMLREGWDVRNVTTIVPLRPFTAAANILPEQTLGRGLRRMTPPGQTNEVVVVIEHDKFRSLYEDELEQEGLPIGVIDADRVKATTVTIFPDDSKDITGLSIEIPALSAAHAISPKLEGLTIDDVRGAFQGLKPLPLGGHGPTEVMYQGRHLITDEVVEQMKVSLPLLQNGLTAISFFVRELEAACKVQSSHLVLAPLLQTFLVEILFGETVGLTDSRLTSRLASQDVREHIRAVFIPLIRQRTVATEKRRPAGAATLLASWKPFQATFSDERPAVTAKRTLFNLVPCNRSLEVALTNFCDAAPDVAAFAKNAGPQALRVDYLTAEHRLALYTPDFFVRTVEGALYLVETKGRQDSDVGRKASAALEWCRSAAKSSKSWDYVFIPQNVMQGLTSNKFADLVRSSAPALKNILSEGSRAPELPLFGDRGPDDADAFYGAIVLTSLQPRAKKAAQDALDLYRYLEKKHDATTLAPVFNTLLGTFDEAAKSKIIGGLQPKLPLVRADQELWLSPDLSKVPARTRNGYEKTARYLKRGLIHGSVPSAIGLLRTCLDHALNGPNEPGGVFHAIKTAFGGGTNAALLVRIARVNTFRNTYIAHHESALTDRALAAAELKYWVETLSELRFASPAP